MSISPTVLSFSMGHLTAIFCLLFIVILILTILFFLFITQKDKPFFNEHELQSDMSTSFNERKSFQHGRFKQYSSTINNPSISSFQMDTDDQNTRSTMNLLSSK
jgi:hypothetical protein